MKFQSVIFVAVFVAVAVAGSTFAAEITMDEAFRASSKFVASDPVGSAVLEGRTVSAVMPRGRLWIASLSPSGHIVMRGTDLADPIISFSTRDFSEPDRKSPAYAILERANAAVAAIEAKGGSRHVRWTKLLSSGFRLLGVATPPATAVVVPPFMDDIHYNQYQPYNDYSPVYNSGTNDLDRYRGRAPCGCVATAAAQMFRHLKWPARIDQTLRAETRFIDDNSVTNDFPIRFDGHDPIKWNVIEGGYPSETGGEWVPSQETPGSYEWKPYTELRGTVAETVRYEIARLLLFCDAMAKMQFDPSGSASRYDIVAGNVGDWYTTGSWVEVPCEDYSQVKADLSAGFPLQVELESHHVVAHGWAEDGDSKYIFLNFGWGGNNDGFYNMDNSNANPDDNVPPMERIYVGHYPRAKPQFDPLPAVSGESFTLSWHFPEIYANNLGGFTVTVSKRTSETSPFSTDFSDDPGVSSAASIWIGEGSWTIGGNTRYFEGGDMLNISSSAEGTYTINGAFALTSASVLTFDIASFLADSATLEIQASFDGGEWQTIRAPGLYKYEGYSSGSHSPEWRTERIFLGNHGGQIARFRVRKGMEDQYDYYYTEGGIWIDDLHIAETQNSTPDVINVDAKSRSLQFANLVPGGDYSFEVAPIISGAPVEGEPSGLVSTSIAGVRHTPIAVEEAYENVAQSAFSASDTSGVWSYSGMALDDTTVTSGDWDSCSNWLFSVTADLGDGELTSNSAVTFDWTVSQFYGNPNCYDVISVSFKDHEGVLHGLYVITNTEAQVQKVGVEVPLNAPNLIGKKGAIVISYNHKGSGFTHVDYYGRIYAPTISNIRLPSAPVVEWDDGQIDALGEPGFIGVTSGAVPLQEGMYSECGTGITDFEVTCLPSVVSLEAHSSHPSLVREEDVTVDSNGGGNFVVHVKPSGINKANYRSRMILTLVGTDLNGTKCYNDLSLRFALDEAKGDIGEFLDWPGQKFTNDIAAPWTCVTEKSVDGYSVQSGEVDHSQTSRLDTVVFGPGVVRFTCKVEGPPTASLGSAGIVFCVDGVPQGELIGSLDWTNVAFEVEGVANHTLSWRYANDPVEMYATGTALLDGVSWTPFSVVTFDANGGDGGVTNVLEAGSVLAAPEVTRVGYTFTGWSPEVPSTVPTSNATYVAQWSINSYDVTFNANGGVGGTNGKQNYGTAIVAPGVARTGYTFGDWLPAVDATVPASNVTYVAQWSINSYKVTFDANGGVGGTSSTLEYGTGILTPNVSRTGHTFGGWSPAVDKTVPAHDVTYVAQWTPNSHTVTFNANGGDGGASEMRYYGSTIGAFPAVVRKRFVLDGWWTAPEGGAQVSGATVVTGDVTYYAHWVEDAPELDTSHAGDLRTDFATAQSPQGVLVDAGGNVAGAVQMKVGKINGKGLVKISASATLMNGKKASAKAFTLNVGGGERSGKLEFKGLGTLNFVLADDGSFTLGSGGGYAMAGVSVGGNLPNRPMAFTIDMDSLPRVDAGYAILEDLLPDETRLNVIGGKKLDAGKAASPKYAKNKATGAYELTGLNDPKKPNVSRLKITYTPKTGMFKGSFNVYATNAASAGSKAPKLKKYTVNVIGLFLNGGDGIVGEGDATLKKPAAGPWPVTIK